MKSIKWQHTPNCGLKSPRISISNTPSLRCYQEFTLVQTKIRHTITWSNSIKQVGTCNTYDQSRQTTYTGKAQTPRGKSGELHNKHHCTAAAKSFSLLLVGYICLKKVPTLDQTHYLWDKSTQKKILQVYRIYLPVTLTLFFIIILQPRREKMNYHHPFPIFHFSGYTLWHNGLICLHSCWGCLLFFLLLQTFCQLAEVKNLYTVEKWGRVPRFLVLRTWKAKLGEVPSAWWLPTWALYYAPRELGSSF